MKTLKIILAWLDWSSYCLNYAYTFPNNLCSLFWRTLFNLIAFPFSYVGHIWNLFIPMYSFKEERNVDNKLNIFFGTLVHLILILIGTFISSYMIEKIWDLNWFLISDPILLNYIKIMGISIVTIGLTVFVIILLVFIISKIISFIKYCFNKTKSNTFKIQKEEKPNMVQEVYKSIKDKYCPLIDWSDIKK